MDVQHKDAAITTLDGSNPNGEFRVVLSAPTRDRDGDTLLPDEWKQPLPEHITFDADHGMSVATTVGSGRPFLNVRDATGALPTPDAPEGSLIVEGTFSSLPRAQEVRTLVNEGHIRTTSVAFMSEKTQKDGVTVSTRELLNGAFVAIPSNREALVLSSKGLEAKAGARNSKADAATIQSIHDHAVELGASCDHGDDDKSHTTDSGDASPADAKALAPTAEDTDDAALSTRSGTADEALPDPADTEADDVALRLRALELECSIIE